MAVGALIQNNPKGLIRLRDGSLVPLTDISGALPVSPAAADGGPVDAPNTVAAGDMSGAIPLAAEATAAPTSLLKQGRGGAANPGPMLEGHKSRVIQAQDDGGADIAAMASALGKAAGKSANNGTTNNPVINGSGDDSMSFMDKIKGLLGLSGDPANADTTGAKIAPPVPVQTDVLPPPPIAAIPVATPADSTTPTTMPAALPVPEQPKPSLMQRLGSSLGLNSAAPAPAPVGGGAIPVASTPAAAAPAEGGGFLDGIIDHGNGYSPEQVETMQMRTGGHYKPDSWFDRLKDNPNRLALLTAGLSAAANASKPGATWMGSLAQGGLSGINTVFQEDASRKEEDLKNREQISKDQLRKDQGVFYGQRADVMQQNASTNADYKGAMAGVNQQRADAASETADAAKVRADAAMKRASQAANGTNNPTALMKNAQFYVSSGIAPDLASAIGLIRQGVSNPTQRASLVTARARMILSTNLNPSDQDTMNALAQAKQQVSQEVMDASPTKEGSGALPAASGGGAPAAAAKPNPGKKGGALPPPKVGTVIKGYSFLGGNPNDPNAWRKQ